jgi:tetratricopeptide (TPR) repeat protein
MTFRAVICRAALLCVAVLSLVESAAAQTASQRSAAEQLFARGRQLMNEKNYVEACPKLEESQRLDPAPGTLLNLATCYERNGQTASAWVTYKLASSSAELSGRKAWAKQARNRALQLEPKLLRLTIVAPAPPRPPGLVLLRDGAEVGQEEWGEAIPLDPGEHSVEARAPGYVTWKQVLSLSGASSTLQVPVLAREKLNAPPAAKATAREPRATAEADNARSGSQPLYKQWWIWGGAGVVAATVLTVILVTSGGKATPDCPREAMGRCL